MPAKLVNALNAIYSITDIKALIVADLRSRGFPDIVSDDVKEPDEFNNPHQVRETGSRPPEFAGFEVRKEIPVKPLHNSRGPG